MNAKISLFAICVKEIIYLSLYNLLDCTFKSVKCTRQRYYIDLEQQKKKVKSDACKKVDDEFIQVIRSRGEE